MLNSLKEEDKEKILLIIQIVCLPFTLDYYRVKDLWFYIHMKLKEEALLKQ